MAYNPTTEIKDCKNFYILYIIIGRLPPLVKGFCAYL